MLSACPSRRFCFKLTNIPFFSTLPTNGNGSLVPSYSSICSMFMVFSLIIVYMVVLLFSLNYCILLVFVGSFRTSVSLTNAISVRYCLLFPPTSSSQTQKRRQKSLCLFYFIYFYWDHLFIREKIINGIPT